MHEAVLCTLEVTVVGGTEHAVRRRLWGLILAHNNWQDSSRSDRLVAVPPSFGKASSVVLRQVPLVIGDNFLNFEAGSIVHADISRKMSWRRGIQDNGLSQRPNFHQISSIS